MNVILALLFPCFLLGALDCTITIFYYDILISVGRLDLSVGNVDLLSD